jgi:ABC-2 type transport system permease protein
VTYAATHLASVPLRALVAIPFAVVLLATTAQGSVESDPALLAVFFASLAGAWLLTFFFMLLIGSLGLFVERSLAIFEIYMGVFAVASGYLVPLELLPDWAQTLADWTPFRYMLAFPVEVLTGRYELAGALGALAIQWTFVVAVIASALLVWRAGLRRYEAYGS